MVGAVAIIAKVPVGFSFGLAIAIQTPVDGEFEDVEEKEEVAPFPEVRTRCEVLKAVESVQISASSIAKPSKRRLTFLFLNWNLMEIKP